MLLSSITQPQSVCFKIFISTQKVRALCGNTLKYQLPAPQDREKERSSYLNGQIRLVQLMSWSVSSLNTSACQLILSTTDSCTYFTPAWTKSRYPGVCRLSTSPPNSTFGLTLEYLHKSQLSMSNEHKCRAKAERHSRLSVPVIFHKTMCQILWDVHHYDAWEGRIVSFCLAKMLMEDIMHTWVKVKGGGKSSIWLSREVFKREERREKEK